MFAPPGEKISHRCAFRYLSNKAEEILAQAMRFFRLWRTADVLVGRDGLTSNSTGLGISCSRSAGIFSIDGAADLLCRISSAL